MIGVEGKGMEVLEAIRGRRSIRAFKSEKNVPDATVDRLIDAACWAPSAGNIQPWEFIVVRKAEMKERLVKAAYGQAFIGQAPVVIVVCADVDRCSQGYGERGRTLYCIQDTAAAVQNILLTAYSLGLGTCWIGAFSEESAREALRIPRGIRPVAIVPVGFSTKSPSPRSKRPITQIVHRENFGRKMEQIR
jgi:nitroreductase